ncbi:MAG: DNA primase, partial [candidate division NC10 bacterium]
PSFMVNPKKGIFHCFGCGAGGDAFGFLMRHERLSFPEAVRALAQGAGIELPVESARAEPEGRREHLLKTMALASQFYAEVLWNRGEGERARRYIEARGLSPEVARRFGLGYAPDGWDSLLGFMKAHSVSEEILVQAGLVLPRAAGSGFYDRFRGRLLFPIRDPQGRAIAFGGRAMGQEEPKYLNSPETPLYSKGQMLYGLDLARAAMRERNRALLVEGYVDCLMAHQHGFGETVAALGTAFTAAQLQTLRRHADETIVVFDGDSAGSKATQRVEELLDVLADSQAWLITRRGNLSQFTTPLDRPTILKALVLPAQHDPDSFLREHGGEAFAQEMLRARSLTSYVVDRVLSEEDVSTPRGRTTAFARVSLVLSKFQSPTEALEAAREAALKLGVDQTQLWIEAQRLQGSLRKPATGEPVAPEPGIPPLPATERDMVRLLAQVGGARERLLPLLEEEDLTHPGLRVLLAAMKASPAAPPEALMADLPGDRERGLLASLLMVEQSWPAHDALITEYARRFEIRHRLKRIRLVAQAI